jgi:hypothetical protein
MSDAGDYSVNGASERPEARELASDRSRFTPLSSAAVSTCIACATAEASRARAEQERTRLRDAAEW